MFEIFLSCFLVLGRLNFRYFAFQLFSVEHRQIHFFMWIWLATFAFCMPYYYFLYHHLLSRCLKCQSFQRPITTSVTTPFSVKCSPVVFAISSTWPPMSQVLIISGDDSLELRLTSVTVNLYLSLLKMNLSLQVFLGNSLIGFHAIQAIPYWGYCIIETSYRIPSSKNNISQQIMANHRWLQLLYWNIRKRVNIRKIREYSWE